VITVSGKGSGRVSMAGLICLKPGARGHLFYWIRIHRGRKGERRSLSEADYADLIATAVAFLLSDDASYITGAHLAVDGASWTEYPAGPGTCAVPGPARTGKMPV